MEMMNTARVNAYAKINLTLDITGREGGFHMLDSLVTTIDLYDRIFVKKRRDKLCSVYMHGMKSEDIPTEENNALRAAEAFVARFQTCGADVTIHKNIPIGAGLGGSSADAAGTLLALAKLYHVTDMGALKSVADTLGSDTGYLLYGGFARLQGRGERVEPLKDGPQLHMLLLIPREGVETPECYQKFDEIGSSCPPRTPLALEALQSGNFEWAVKSFGNHLTEAAVSLNPAVGEALTQLKMLSPLCAVMSGSGSACYALFETRELAEWAKSRYRGKCRAIVTGCPRIPKKMRNPFVLSEDEGK